MFSFYGGPKEYFHKVSLMYSKCNLNVNKRPLWIVLKWVLHQLTHLRTVILRYHAYNEVFRTGLVDVLKNVI